MTEIRAREEFKAKEIKSYVIRGSRMTEAQQKAWQDYWPQFGLDPAAQPFDWPAIFGNANPLVLEIGFGMGGSLLQMAKAAPELNFIGVEVHRPGVGALLKLMAEDGVQNIRLFNCDANLVLADCLPDASLQRLQLYFPDPWHKKRHHKRRLVQAAFIERLRPKLRLGGLVHMATDWQHYAEQMLEVMQQAEGFENLAPDGRFCPRPEFRPETKFERRGLRLGHGVWDILFRRER